VALPCAFKTPAKQSCDPGTLLLLSAGFADGDLALLAWNNAPLLLASRGINAAVLSGDTHTTKGVRSFDLYADSSAAAAAIAWLDVTAQSGDVLAVVVQDEGSQLTSEPLAEYMASAFGAQLSSEYAYRWSYALVAQRGSSVPLFEKSAAPGQGRVWGSVDMPCA
jgi:hypothetical protein